MRRIVLTVGLLGFLLFSSQAQTVEQTVSANLDFFEYLFESVTMLSGVQQADQVQHFKLTDAQGQVLIKVAIAFKTQEDVLRARAKAAMQLGPGDTLLSPIRIQRNQLLQQTAIDLMQQLGSDGASRLTNDIAKANAAKPSLP